MNNDLISREWLEDAFDNLCCHNCKICRNFRIKDSFYKCALIDNAPTVFFDWEKSDAYLDCIKRIMSLEKENEELRQFLKKQGGRQ